MNNNSENLGGQECCYEWLRGGPGLLTWILDL